MKRKTLVVLAILSVCFLFFGCAPAGVTTGIEVKGTWLHPSSYGDETWVISENSITYSFGGTQVYSADIDSYSNDSFNASETGAGEYGYAVIKYTAVDGAGTGTVGGYNIFRWQNYTGSTSAFTQGYKNVGSDYPNNVNYTATSSADAISIITAADGYFGGWSTGASLQ